MNRIKHFLLTLWKRPDLYWNDLNDFDKQNNTEKEIKAKKQIIELIYVICFIMASFLIQIIILKVNPLSNSMNKNDESVTGLIFFAWAIIFVIWVFAILHRRKIHKHQILRYLKEKIQLTHE